MQITHTRSLCGKGLAADRFGKFLIGVTTDADDRLLALGDNEVKVFSPGGALEGTFPLGEPGWSITAAGENIWIGLTGAITRFDRDGRPQGRIEDAQRLGQITGLAAIRNVLVAADAPNHTIHLFEDGVWQREIGADVNTRGFMIPNGVLDLVIDPKSETLIVAHPQKHRVERYDLQGKLLGKFGRFGMQEPGDFGGCCNPTNITATVDGRIVVSEKAPPRVKVYSAEGEFLGLGGEDVFDPNTKNIDLAADSRGNLYAADPLTCMIEVFRLGPAEE